MFGIFETLKALKALRDLFKGKSQLHHLLEASRKLTGSKPLVYESICISCLLIR